MTKEEWISYLTLFAQNKRTQEPVPPRSELTEEEEYQCRVIGGHLISWLNNWGPNLIMERNVLANIQGWDKDPHIVILTEGPGLAATREILHKADVNQITWLTPDQFEEFQEMHPDKDQVHHCVLETWFSPVPEDREGELRRSYQVDQGTLLFHHDHTIMGPLFTRGGLHLWLWKDGALKMLEEGFSSWVS